MSGTRKGGLAAAPTNKKKFGDNFYAEIGSIGGQHSKKGYKYLGEELTGSVYLNKATDEVQIFKNNKLVEHKHFSFKTLFKRFKVGAMAR